LSSEELEFLSLAANLGGYLGDCGTPTYKDV